MGDGHLQAEPLLHSLKRSAASSREVRCIFVEAQPLGRPTIAYRIHDAHTRLVERGQLEIAALRAGQPWEAPLNLRLPPLGSAPVVLTSSQPEKGRP